MFLFGHVLYNFRHLHSYNTHVNYSYLTLLITLSFFQNKGLTAMLQKTIQCVSFIIMITGEYDNVLNGMTTKRKRFVSSLGSKVKVEQLDKDRQAIS